MPRLIWSPSALADIQRFYGFLAKKDKDTARRAIKTIRAGVKMLARQSVTNSRINLKSIAASILRTR
ncbi:type II toxin-antitoxin system RelE/ParE family toxin [Photorhabdus noenieputensis]|uniref:type II toxin-antitoxin system RelE/ParE family toxin n=1 Tax=Photorhabdus noenieputensis TaxID=1208607 RepID=UPI001FCF7E52|nr:type II toxin-antitoxin system RelE/ParE family toxin [Photorhabdus noenieputensis]MCK3670406.1 type II toxin-antitoxin system RelE/ParE family toxin [Photorhabdus noenieputensis]